VSELDWDGAVARLEGLTATAIRVEAEAIQAEAAGRAPVRTGTLRDSAFTLTTPEGSRVGFAAPYAAAVEARRPFLGPAVASARGGLLARLAAIIRGG
jgi:hypothetical protein